MKRILHISQYYNPHIGGIESICEDIVNILKTTEEYEQRVLCFGNEDVDMLDGTPIIRCKPLIKVRSQCLSLKYTKILKNIIKEFNPDIILLHFPNPMAARSLLKCKYKGKIIIFHHLDIVKQRILKYVVKPYLNKIYKRADKIIATSQNYVDYSDELKPYKDKISIIPLAYRKENVELQPGEDKIIKELKTVYKPPIAIFTGRHVGYKGIEFGIDAVKDIKDITFLIAGYGPLTKKLKKQAEGYSNIRFIGMLSPRNYRVYINLADFFIFPSWRKNEAFGISLVEALACGKPAVTFNIKGSAVNWININNVTGIECINSDVNSLKEGINKLKDNEELRLELGKNGIKRVNELFTPETFRNNIIVLFSTLLIYN